jgi:glucose-6-phosphate isomerase
MENLKIDIKNTLGIISKDEIVNFQSIINSQVETLHSKTGAGNDFLGWLNLPSSITDENLSTIEATANNLSGKIEVLIVIGIGGSYLGAKAVNDALSDNFELLKNKHKAPLLLFAGHNIGEDYMKEMLSLLDDKSYGITVISKSGTTTEPAIAFRLLKEHLEAKEGKEEARKRIIAITDANKGALRQLADNEGYTSFVIPDDVGGRYSVLTPVGLVPLAIGGFDIRSLVQGAKDMENILAKDQDIMNNPANLYAATRNILYQKGKKIEILVNYHNKLHFFMEWWKQLYGESEGKENKGIYPASVDFTTDLHSMGQYIQEGERHLFETVISIGKPDYKVQVPNDKDNLDKLNYLEGKRIDEVNKMAELGTTIAHVDGGVPNISIEIPELSAYYLGQLIYFFEKACAISGYLLDVNPFNQPGVEAYKKNMFALLEKPGFEEETKKIKERL